MIVSAAEIAEAAKKATRGCGYDWGIAEDMAWATRWLNERGLRGAEKLVHALEQDREQTPPQIKISQDRVELCHPSAQALSPLNAAPSVADFLIAKADANPAVTMEALSHPLLLVPFIALASERLGKVLAEWRTVDGSRVQVAADNGLVTLYAINAFTLIQALAHDISCRAGGNAEGAAPELFNAEQLRQQRERIINEGCRLTDSVWQKLLQFAHRTYVPISESSRLQGAGAGLTDND